MQLLVIRHAIAEDREELSRTGKSDDLRPLTQKGRRKMRRAARGLRRLVPELGRLASSPLVRAVETAELVEEAYGDLKHELLKELSPGTPPAELVARLRALPATELPIAVVGHEPDLSELISWLLSGHARSFVELKKGAACLLQADGALEPKKTRLRWLLSPGQLRRLGR